MQDVVRETLAGLIKKYGTSLVDDPRRLEGLLRDMCGENKREINALTGALKLRVPVDLLNTSNVPLEMLSARLIKRVEDDLGMKEELARWAVESWVMALGVKLSVASIASPKPAPESLVKDEDVKPVPTSVQKTLNLAPVNKKRDINFFFKILIPVAIVCIIILLLVMAQPRISKPPEGISISSLSLDLMGVPGAAKFPIKYRDTGNCTVVNYPYYMGKTEVTCRQWKTVYDWAVKHGYTFDDSLEPGWDGGPNYAKDYLSWYNCVIWCNALTEYSNNVEGTNYSCVYQYNGVIVRDATKQTICDNIKANSSSKGFRLPTSMEWELAARYIDGKHWTPGNYASGASASWEESNSVSNNASNEVAWYWYSIQGKGHPVATKKPNALGIYDMSGNADEWCFDRSPGRADCRVTRGGSDVDYVDKLPVGRVGYDLPTSTASIGFRIVRTL